jgi:glycosyltransferase involved in cell wall biosynthesis
MTADAVGGVWTYAVDLAGALQACGTRVTLAVMGPPPRESQIDDARSRGVELVHAPYSLEWMHGVPDDFERSAAWLLELADRSRAELVHLNGFSHAALAWRVPTVVVAHSCVRTWWRSVHGKDAPAEWDLYTARVTAGLRSASLVVAPTRSLLEDITREYQVNVASVVIPNGSSAVNMPSGAEAKRPLVFSSGRLWDEAKNVAALASIAAQLEWPVYLAGSLDQGSGPVTQSGSAHYLGMLSRVEMAEWYFHAAIYALPARYEPFGLSILEAAAAGCALVLGDIPTLRENWSGVALFVPPDDPRALREALEDLIHDEGRRDELGRLACERSAGFSVSRMVDSYLAAYAGLLAPARVA